MKIWLKILLGVIAGFGGGFAAGFLVHKKLNNIQFEEISEEELDKLIADIPEDVRIAAEQKKTKSKSGQKHLSNETMTDPDKLRNAMQGKTPYIQMDESKKEEYSKIWNTVKDYSSKENADELPVEDEDLLKELDLTIDEFDGQSTPDVVNEPPLKTEPYRITLGEFYEERREYDKITIDWYDEDDIVLDEREEIIADPVSYVGCSMKELFNAPNPDGDPDAAFVRNDRYGTDYEVIRHHASYFSSIAGQ